MNRHTRRALDAIDERLFNREQKAKERSKHSDSAPAHYSGPPARKDGRPLYFDVQMNSHLQCYYHMLEDDQRTFGYGECVINDPANSPREDGAIYSIAISKLPDNAVIFNPYDNTCRNKQDTMRWTEGPAIIKPE